MNQSSSFHKRLRISQACLHCRKKKIRCDGQQPHCSNCQQIGIVCEYVESKKRGPRKGYVQSLEHKLAQMEKMLGYNDKLMLNSLSSIRAYSDDLPPLEIVNHLVNIFFKHINHFLPFLNQAVLKTSIKNRTISRPLLYSIMAISARFSSHSSIHINSPYLAGEEFVKRALSLVNNNMLQPTMANIQFWGIMSCVEYGRASGSMSWIYADIAIRLCRELSYHKEEILSTAIHTEDGSIDAVAMAMRRRIFWSCFMLDKVTSAGTHRIQCVGQADYDAHTTTLAEIILLKEPDCPRDMYGYPIHEDSLLNITKHYITCIEKFGQVNRWMSKMSNHRQNDKALWPPIAEYRSLDMQLCSWQESLPEKFHFTEGNLKYHQKFADTQHLAVWLNCHAMWCCSMIILHRGSLAYTTAVYYETTMTDELKTKIQRGLETCYKCADTAIDIFGAMKDVCGHNMLPYIGYLVYVLATFLMASTFSDIDKDGEKCQKGLTILHEFIERLSPYWLSCKNLADVIKKLLVAHEKYKSNRSQTDNQSQQISKTTFFSQDLPFSTTPYNQHDHYFAQERLHNAQVMHDQLKSTESDYFKNINFNSIGFLYDTELFGHLVLGSSRIQTAPYLQDSQSKC